MEDSFPFSFGLASDEDEEFNDIFCPAKAKAKVVKSKAPSAEEYHAQIDADGWFHQTGASVLEVMQNDKNGANKVKMRADHYYMLHQYQDAYEIAKEYCRVVSLQNQLNLIDRIEQSETEIERTSNILKVTDSKEMQEMALRCALKLNKLDEAAAFADELTLQDIGTVFLKAKAFIAVGRYNAAALNLVQFQKTKSSNYSIWKALGECLHQSSKALIFQSEPKLSIPTLISRPYPSLTLCSYGVDLRRVKILALISILRARYLMLVSTWSNVSYAKVRFDQELRTIDDLRRVLERECELEMYDSASQLKEFESSLQDQDLKHRRLEDYENKIVIPALELLQRMKQANGEGLKEESESALEIVEFIVNSWDTQLVDFSASGGGTDEDNDDVNGLSVRDK